MAATQPAAPPAAEDPAQVPAAALRALRDALAGLGRAFGYGQQQNANTVLVTLGASYPDAQALYEYLDAHAPEPRPDPE